MKINKYFLILLLIFSCDEDGSSPLGPDIPSDEDISNSEIFVGLANEELEEEFNSLYNSQSIENCLNSNEDSFECYQLIDFSDAYDYYQQALSLNPDNVEAHFGVGITEFLNITQDQDLYDAINEWNEYFNPQGDYSNSYGFLPTIDAFSNFRFDKILNLIPINGNMLLLSLDEGEAPALSDVQNLLETSFLNRLNTSIEHFDIVLESDFTFDVTGEMQGSSSFQSLELDNVEIYILKSQMHFLVAMINLIIAYDFDFPYNQGNDIGCLYEEPDFDINSNWEWLDQNSSFLSIRRENALPSVISNLNLIHSSLDSALDYIQSETDFQTDDVITFDEVEGNYNDINENLDLMYSYINGNYSYYDVPSWIQSEAEWQGVSELELCNQYEVYCPETTINLSNFFNSPIDDLKSLFPQYNITEHQCYCIGSDFNDIGYDCPYLNWDATSWEEWKDGISDPTISGLFPDFSVDDMLQYFEIVCNQFDAYFSCE